MKLEGTRFGTIEYTKEDIVTLTDGMIGFAQFTKFVVVTTKEGSPFRWLQSAEQPKLAFLVADPNRFIESYSPEISNTEARNLGLGEDTPHLVLVTSNVPTGKPNEATINLAAPIIVNLEKNIAKQVILDDQSLSMRYSIFQGETKQAVPVAA